MSQAETQLFVDHHDALSMHAKSRKPLTHDAPGPGSEETEA